MQSIPTYVEGLDKALGGGIPEGNAVLVSGSPGTMKSTLVYSILHKNAERGIPGLFVTLEEPSAGLREKMSRLGMPPLPDDKLYLMDLTHLRVALREKELGRDWTKILEMLFSEARNSSGYRLFALDSLEVLYTLAAFKDPRRELFYLLALLRELEFSSLIVSEVSLESPTAPGNGEDYLADGIFLLEQFSVGKMDVQLRIRTVKMRGTRHDRGYFTLEWDGHRFVATRSIVA